MLKEYMSKNLNVPFIYLKDKEKYLCANGVVFTKEEYLKGIDLKAEYEKRARSDELYDYSYAKSTGNLRKKRTARGTAGIGNKPGVTELQRTDVERTAVVSTQQSVRPQNVGRVSSASSVMIICALLGFTSVISMYVSTLHTAVYLYDFADTISAWLMSASVTAYNSTAFEVSVLFHNNKRNFMASIFMFLWIIVTFFSMATSVSVFYDRYNFNETAIVEENKESDSSRLALTLLQKKEADLREAIDFKKKDIQYRQEHEYATSAVRNELTKLEAELQSNLSSQQSLLEKTPDAVETENVQKKESLFKFLGRILHIDGGILEFIMSTLSAIFVNLIAPLSLTAVIELMNKNKLTK